MKEGLQDTILTATKLILLIIFIPFASSIEASIDIPDKMFPHSEIEVSVSTPEESQYDIKIFFEDAGGEISGEIETREGWKSTRFYIQDITFKIETFKVRLKDAFTPTDDISICVRIRESASTSTPAKQCSTIELEESPEEQDTDEETGEESDDEEEKEFEDDREEKEDGQNQEESDEQEKKEDKTGKPSKPESRTAPKTPPSIQIQQELPPILETAEDDGPILLRKKQVEVEYTSRGKSRIIINYFLALTVLIALFLILKREQRYREI